LQGRIFCVGQPGRGTTFTVELRCRVVQRPAAAEESPPAAEPAPPAPPGNAGSLRRPRVLVVEDTEINRQLACILLRRMGYDTDVAENGQQALAALARGHYALVLMDCMMPVMDGYEATRRLRAMQAETGAAHVPVIALTASVVAGDRDRCLAAGMDDYLAKPFTAQTLQAAVDCWIGAETGAHHAAGLPDSAR